jgi:hypothetical protein
LRGAAGPPALFCRDRRPRLHVFEIVGRHGWMMPRSAGPRGEYRPRR